MVGPNIGWSNAIPDAVGEVNFSIDGSTLIFSGAAYHDKVCSFTSPDFLRSNTYLPPHRTGPTNLSKTM